MARRKKKTQPETESDSATGTSEQQATLPEVQEDLSAEQAMPPESKEKPVMTKQDQPKNVVIDYRGQTGVDGEGRPVHHRSSPRVFILRDPAVKELVLQPGANLVDAEQWERYLDGDEAVAKLVKRGALTDLCGELPEREWELRDLIDRTIARDALDWIVAQERAGQNRERMVQAAGSRVARTTVCTWEHGSWVNAAPNMGAGARA